MIGSNIADKTDSDWQENWSFIGKSNLVANDLTLPVLKGEQKNNFFESIDNE